VLVCFVFRIGAGEELPDFHPLLQHEPVAQLTPLIIASFLSSIA
jgi:hypothetical protein